ncbi:Type 4 prepilin peptidase 1. Aspartic peptidase. MEROPS family A24A [Acidobacteriia bacterium SbA2]|nr:Type 4 prepilin peptidase 1. Aspartic peptidase. MEROPS family A24A [Acidobacteriia bacterium SbA2]
MLYLFITLFGLLFGSFLNVCIVRLPHKQSIVLPRSHCPHCNHTIRWYDNIPLVSYALLGGRCRDCHARISPQYAIVEALTAILLVATFRRFGLSPEFVKYSALVMLLIVVIFTDLRERLIPHSVTIFGISLGAVLSMFIEVDSRPLGWLAERMGLFLPGTVLSVLGALLGALIGGGLFYAVGTAFFILGGRKKDYLGFGDVMLMLMVGTFLGPPLTLLTILLGSFAGSIVALSITLAAPRFRNYPWPYGTFLGLAAVYAALDGARLLEIYFRWSGIAG